MRTEKTRFEMLLGRDLIAYWTVGYWFALVCLQMGRALRESMSILVLTVISTAHCCLAYRHAWYAVTLKRLFGLFGAFWWMDSDVRVFTWFWMVFGKWFCERTYSLYSVGIILNCYTKLCLWFEICGLLVACSSHLDFQNIKYLHIYEGKYYMYTTIYRQGWAGGMNSNK